MNQLAKAVQYVQIKELSLESSKLKEDLVELLLSLLNNSSLENLNLTDNQGGDRIAETLSKVFQHNNTLNTVYWDANDTTLAGLKSIKLGLQRNKSITQMPLPLRDISAILKTTNIDHNQVIQIITEIQNRIYTNASAPPTPTFALENTDNSTATLPSMYYLTNTTKSVAATPKKGKRKGGVDMVKASRLFGVKGTNDDVSGEISSEHASEPPSISSPGIPALAPAGPPTSPVMPTSRQSIDSRSEDEDNGVVEIASGAHTARLQPSTKKKSGSKAPKRDVRKGGKSTPPTVTEDADDATESATS